MPAFNSLLKFYFAIPLVILLWFSSSVYAQDVLSSGTGFYVHPSGIVMTNRHVVEGCADVRVNGVTLTSPPILDAQSDLAALVLNVENAVPALELRAYQPRLAEPLYVAGYPLSDLLSESVKVTTGSLNSMAGIRNDARFIQISAPIQPGNSGGPVLGRAGDVMGIATSTLSDDAYEDAQNVNFAVKSTEAIRFLSNEGLPFLVSEEEGQIADPIDMVSTASDAVVYLTCHSFGAQPLEQPSGDFSGLVSWPGHDVLGFDYLTVRDTTFLQCSNQCQGDGRCRAITFNSRHNICFLKTGALLLIRNGDAIGAVSVTVQDQLIVPDMTVEADRDSPGGDYLRLRDSNFVECTLECVLDQRCLAFAYVRESADCWLKDRINSIVEMPGVEFGRF